MQRSGERVLMRGKAMPVGARVLGKSLSFPQFCYEYKTAQKNKICWNHGVQGSPKNSDSLCLKTERIRWGEQSDKKRSNLSYLLKQDACEAYKWARERVPPWEHSGLQFYNQRKSGEGKRSLSSHSWANIISSSSRPGRKFLIPIGSSQDLHGTMGVYSLRSQYNKDLLLWNVTFS